MPWHLHNSVSWTDFHSFAISNSNLNKERTNEINALHFATTKTTTKTLIHWFTGKSLLRYGSTCLWLCLCGACSIIVLFFFLYISASFSACNDFPFCVENIKYDQMSKWHQFESLFNILNVKKPIKLSNSKV